MYKILTLTYLLNGAVYNQNTVHSFDNENLGTSINIAVPEDYEDFSFVMDCQNGTITKQYSLGSGETSYTIELDDSLTLAGTLELQLWATILSGDETVKVQWQKYNLTIDDALNISTITAEDNPDIIATHTAQIQELYNITDVLDITGDGTLFLSDDGTYQSPGTIGTRDYSTITNKPQINSVELVGNKTSANLGLQPAGNYLTVEVDPTVPAWAKNSTKPTYTYSEVGAEPANSNIQSHISNSNIHLSSTEKTNVGKLISTGDGSKYLGNDGNYTTVVSGTTDYTALSNKPSINSVELTGNKTSANLGLQPAGSYLTAEVDPTVPSWAKAESKPSYTLDELSDVTITTPVSNDIAYYTGTGWANKTFDVSKTFAGFVNRTDSNITINGSGVVTLAPAVTSFTVYTMGTKHVLTNTQTVTVTSDQTITYIYLDSAGVLQKSLSIWDLTSGLNIPVAIVFKDGSTYALTDERHGHERNKAWHNWAHNNIGAMYKSGLTGTFTTSTLSVQQGIIYDEDLQADTGSTRTTCSLWYRNATTGMRLVRGSNYAKAVSGGGILQYDNGSGTLQDVTNNRYATNWVYATNDPTEPIYCVVGQGDYSNLTNARNASAPTINLSTAEWKLIYRVIYQRTSGVPAGTYVESADFRTVQTGVPTSASTTDHNALINRDAPNSHPASAISYDNGGDVLSDVQTTLANMKSISLVQTSETITFPQSVNKINDLIYKMGVTGQTSAIFESASTSYVQVVQVDTNRYVVSYRDNGNSSYGTACVLTVNPTDNTVTSYNPVVFESATVNYTNIAKLDTNKVIVTYQDAGNSSYGTACVLTINPADNTITAGTPTVFASVNTITPVVCQTATDKVIVAYRDSTNSSYGKAVVLTVSGTTISAGSIYTFESTNGISNPQIIKLNSTQVMVSYYSLGLKLRVLDNLSGTALNVGSSIGVTGGADAPAPMVALSESKIFIVYGNYFAYCSIFNVYSGNNIINYGNVPILFNQIATSSLTACLLEANKVMVSYKDGSNNNYGTSLTFNVIGEEIFIDRNKRNFNTVDSTSFSLSTIDSSRALVCYQDNGNSNYGTTRVLKLDTCTGYALSAQFNSNNILGRSDNINLVPYTSFV